MKIFEPCVNSIKYKPKVFLFLALVMLPFSLVEVMVIFPIINVVLTVGINSVNNMFILLMDLMLNLIDRMYIFALDSTLIILILSFSILLVVAIFAYLLFFFYSNVFEKQLNLTFLKLLNLNLILYKFIFITIVYFIVMLVVFIPYSTVIRILIQQLEEYGFRAFLLMDFNFYVVVAFSTLFAIIYILALIISFFLLRISNYLYKSNEIFKIYTFFKKDDYVQIVVFISVWLIILILYKLLFYQTLLFLYNSTHSYLILAFGMLINDFIKALFLYLLLFRQGQVTVNE